MMRSGRITGDGVDVVAAGGGVCTVTFGGLTVTCAGGGVVVGGVEGVVGVGVTEDGEPQERVDVTSTSKITGMSNFFIIPPKGLKYSPHSHQYIYIVGLGQKGSFWGCYNKML